LLVDFIDDFEKEIDLKSKIISSEKNQLIKIVTSFQNYLVEKEIEIKPTKVTEGDHPVAYVKFSKKTSDVTISSLIEDFLDSCGTSSKKHKFKDCFPFYSLKNNTVPGLLEGRGHSLLSIVSQGAEDSLVIKIEFLKENQIVRVLDAKLETLTVVLWNGKSMSRSSFFFPDFSLDEEFINSEGMVNLELISNAKTNPYKIKADFYISTTQGLILEKITEIARG